MKKLLILSHLLLLLSTTLWAAQRKDDSIPDLPSELTFPDLAYDPPQAADYRHELAHGVVAFLVEDKSLPLVNISILVRAGDYLDPEDKIGLASTVGSQMRSGGTAQWSADDFDEEADFLAANFSSGVGGTSGSVSGNFLSKDLDQALEMLFDMLHRPRFQADRLELFKSQVLQRMERRNDRTAAIEAREWNRLLRGPDHFSSQSSTQASISSITQRDLKDFHDRYFVPANFVVAASGDFDSDQLQEKLNRYLTEWSETGERSPDVPAPDYTPKPGVYLVDKPDVNQGRVSMGHLGVRRDDPDRFAIDLMNDILGGSGFTSRITTRVRSDEGLAYSAGSSFSFGTYYPGFFRASFQSKSRTCAEAAQIILDEIKRIRTELVSEEELKTVKTSAIEIFPRYFSSASAVAATFANGELTGLDPNFWNTYRDNLRKVTREDVLRVAKQHLDPSKLVILVVGNKQEILAGNPDKPQYSFLEMDPDQKIEEIPLPDPLTMKYP